MRRHKVIVAPTTVKFYKKNLVPNKLNTIFSFQAAKESNAFPCHVSPRCHAKVMFFILHKCISSFKTSVFPNSLWNLQYVQCGQLIFSVPLKTSVDGNSNIWTKTSVETYHYILMDLFLHCVHHLWLCTVWNEVWTQHVITSITTDQNNQTLITDSYFQRNEIFRSNFNMSRLHQPGMAHGHPHSSPHGAPNSEFAHLDR